MKPIDMLGFGPKREETRQENGTWLITVTPPPATGFSPSSLILTEEQYRRYLQWRNMGVLIQEALPELTPDQREILMTGIGPEEFKAAFSEENDQ